MGVPGLMRWCERHANKIHESGGYNHVIFWDWYQKIYGYGLQGSSWCGAAVCVENAWGAGWTPPSDFTGVWAIESWGRAHGRYHSGASGIEPGDILILLGHGVHTGIARSKYRLGYVKTYEGNTSSTGSGSQNNGDGYYKKSRPYYQITGYVRVHDMLNEHNSPKRPRDFHLGKLPLKVDGARGPQTTGHMQKAIDDIVDGYWCRMTRNKLKAHLNHKLNLSGRHRLKENGRFGVRAVRKLQQYLGVKQTGVWGRGTTEALQKRLNAGKF